MAENNKNNSSQQGSKANATAPAKRSTGQQTGGKRNQKVDRDRADEEHYRSSEQKKQSGNHGGNR